jgi:protein-tyrosine phosphatase
MSPRPIKILFVCLGNICRSPTAEAIFRKKFAEKGIPAEIDSAGTSNYHVGERSDERSIHHATACGYEMTHLGRQVHPKDFEKFDIIFAMDRSNFTNLKKVCPDPKYLPKLHMLTDFSTSGRYQEVPDPWAGTAQDFEEVIAIIEDCVEGVIEKWCKG